MKNFFNNMKLSRFQSDFSSEEKCLEYLAGKKWEKGYKCRKCGHTNFCKGKKPFSRRCTRCKAEESATAHTLFHGCRFPLPSAFKLMYLVCQKPDISSYELSRLLETRQMTCWKFKKKLTECLKDHDGLLLD
ncbi:MAG: transposase [Bacteroidetes bacterium]|nr:transposase [Bacteroidota bacterium]